jgi:hypothetical protein
MTKSCTDTCPGPVARNDVVILSHPSGQDPASGSSILEYNHVEMTSYLSWFVTAFEPLFMRVGHTKGGLRTLPVASILQSFIASILINKELRFQ